MFELSIRKKHVSLVLEKWMARIMVTVAAESFAGCGSFRVKAIAEEVGL